MSEVAEYLEYLQKDPQFSNQISFVTAIPEKKSRYVELKKDLPQNITNYLDQHKIRLYTHQCETINAVRDGSNVILCTPTASGKTLAFTLPVLERLTDDPSATALYLYPTKALTQDQLLQFIQLEQATNVEMYPGIFDGDTNEEEKSRIKRESRLVLSNPFMLNRILPWHTQWVRFYSGLKFVIIDEAHRYRGVFGSNVATLIRRVRRICNYYGSNPVFILASATLRNPTEFAENLIGLPVHLVNNDGAPSGRKYFALYNPDFKAKQSTESETTKLLIRSVQEGFQSICFTNSRKMAEIITINTRAGLEKWRPGSGDSVSSYRGGTFLLEEGH
jgi:DEAD/DEAH box helicase domain-containing protein